MVDIGHLRQWVGRSVEDEDVLAPRHAGLMAATLGLDPAPFVAGAPLPPLWHWLYFLEGLPPAALAEDGHAGRGGFLPPVPLHNRLWAGGRVSFAAPLTLGARAEKRSTILAVEGKTGRSGELVFVTVLHELSQGGTLAVREEQDLVYRNPGPPAAAPAGVALPVAAHSEPWAPDAVELFRYSALTFNGHRIHYDADYCRQAEGYAQIVVHGPLSATRLALLAQRLLGQPLGQFDYRGLQPALLGARLNLHGHREGREATVWVGLPDGTATMLARARAA